MPKKEIITKEDLERVVPIARLRQTPAQLEALAKDASAILEYFSLIESIPESVKAESYVLGKQNPLRKDAIEKCDPKAIRRGFAHEQDGYMQAPKSM